MFSRISRLKQVSHISGFRNTLKAEKSIVRRYAKMAPDHSQWKFNHTMLRVKDPQKSIDYYKLLGLSQINKMDYPDNKFTLYFLG